jgi:hypothetical protein
MGLVGGLGGGMHLIAGGGVGHARCWFSCAWSAYGGKDIAATILRVDAVGGECRATDERASSFELCSICLLLAGYQAVSVPRFEAANGQLASSIAVVPTQRHPILDLIKCCRPRGPPAARAPMHA